MQPNCKFRFRIPLALTVGSDIPIIIVDVILSVMSFYPRCLHQNTKRKPFSTKSKAVTGGVGDLLREPGTACNHRETGIGSGPVPPGMGVVPAPVGFSRSGPKVTTSPKIKKGVSHSDLRQISLVVSLPALCLLWPYGQLDGMGGAGDHGGRRRRSRSIGGMS